MKNLYLFILISFLSFNAIGQGIEITPSYGYQFGAKVNYGYNSYLKMNSSDQFRITVGVETYSGLMAEFSYINMSTELRLKDIIYDVPLETKISDLNADWFLIGATRYLKDGKVKPFAGGSLGLVVVSPKNENRDIINNLSSTTRFAFSFKAGVNIMFTDVIGLNLQGDLFFPVNWAGVYVGTDGGGISTGSTVILGGFSGGLVFKLGNG